MGILLGCGTQGQQQSPRYAIEGPHNLVVHMTGLDIKVGGAVMLALYDSEESWLKPDQVYKARLVIVDAPEQHITLYGLPAGTYAIAAFQDNNENSKLDRWFWLLPREPFAVSKVSQLRGPPRFNKSAFDLPGTQQVVLAFH